MSQAGGGRDFGIYSTLIFGTVGLVFLSIIALVGLQLVGGVTAGVGGDVGNRTVSPDPQVGTWVKYENIGTFEGSVEQIFWVKDSLGNAIQLDGSDDSFVQSRDAVNLANDDTHTVCQWARVRSGAETQNMTAVSAGGRTLIQYTHNGTAANWSAYFYDDGSSQSYRVNVTAPNQPGNYTHVCAWRNSTHVSIYRNNTRGELKNATVTSVANATLNSTNWNGSLDETRVFDDALNSSQRAALQGYPVGPLENATRTARITYDEGEGTVTAIYFTDTKADISNGVWVTGLDDTILTEGTDYSIRTDPAEIRAIEDGRIEGAPVVWIRYEFLDSDVDTLVPGIRGGFDLLASGAILIPAVAVISVLLGGLLFAVRMADGFGPGRRGGGR